MSAAFESQCEVTSMHARIEHSCARSGHRNMRTEQPAEYQQETRPSG